MSRSQSDPGSTQTPPVPKLPPSVSFKYRWREGWEGFVTSTKDPDDTGAAIRMIGAFSGRTGEREFERFWNSPNGQEVLQRQTTLLETLNDRESLRKLPKGSFGRVYLDWMETEEISAQGLADISAAEQAKGNIPVMRSDDPRKIFFDRSRDMHDMLHVLAGYGRCLTGESGVLAFTYSQTRNTGIGSLSATAYLLSFLPDPTKLYTRARATELRRVIRDGHRRGKKARWLIDADFEALLKLPLDEVRRMYNIEPGIPYEEVRSAGAPILPGQSKSDPPAQAI